MAINTQRDTVYGISQALIGVSQAPIVSRRNPTNRDRAEIGQMWVNRTTGICFFLTSIVANVYTWYAAAAAAAAYTAVGLVTAGTGLVATTGAGTPSGAGLHVAADGANITGATAVTGAITATTTITAGTGLVATTGGLTVTAGGGTITAGNFTVVADDIIATAGNITATAGNIVCTDGNIVNTLGDIVATNGDMHINGAAHSLFMPSGMRITSGAGAPANGLALAIGDIYIRSDAGGAAQRIYIATGVGAWTNVTCAA